MNRRAANRPFRPKVPPTRRSVEQGRRIVRAVYRWVAVCGLAVLGLVGYRAALNWSVFTVTEVRVEDAKNVPAAEIVRRAAVPSGSNIFRLDTREIADRVATHPWVADASVMRRFPRGLIVRIQERIPVAVLNGANAMVVDDVGVVLGPANSEARRRHVLVKGGTKGILQAGTVVEDSVKAALDLLAHITRQHAFQGQRIAQINILKSGSIEVHLQPNHFVVVMRGDDFAAQLARFEVLASALGKGRLSRLWINVSFAGQAVVRSL